MADQPTGTVTMLFTDIEGSTKLLERLGRDRYAEALDLHRRLLREAFERHGGYEVDCEGDSFFVAFGRAEDAALAASDAQQALAAAEWPDGLEFRVRMGVHTGEPLAMPPKYVGLDVHRAARIMAAGNGGQVLLSRATRELLDERFRLRDLGEHRLKDLSAQRVFQLQIEGLPADFPQLKTLENRPMNLPTQATTLIGREKEQEEIAALIRREDVWLLTLTGTGGTGKTRIALQVAAELIDEFPSGVFFVSLAPISDADLVVPTIAQTLGLREQAGEPVLETVCAYLRDKQLLLLLDNFEQIVAAAPAIAALRAQASKLAVLVTSRTPLHLSGEHTYEVPPLTLPDPLSLPELALLSQYEAVALFIERAQAAKAGFSVSNENAPAIAQICVAVDGLPLAVELAAARVRVLPPQALLGRLDQRLKLLTGGAQDLDERQRTVRATIEWSCDLLTEEEKILFGRLAVFVGGCRLEAAEAVCKQGSTLDLATFDGLASLTEKSLLRQREDPDGEPRFWMLETIREYALEQLANQPDAHDLSRAHASHYLQFALQAETGMQGERVSEWLDRLDQESPNLTASLTWSEKNDPALLMRLVNALARFWGLRGQLRTGEAWLKEALKETDSRASRERNVALKWATFFVGMLEGASDTEPLIREWLESSRTLADRKSEGEALYRLGEMHVEDGEVEKGREVIEEGLQVSRELGDAELTAKMLSVLGEAAMNDRDFATAVMLFEESASLHRSGGTRFNVAVGLQKLGAALLDNGQTDEAGAPLREALEIFCEYKNDFEISFVLEGIAGVIAAEDVETAVQLLGKAEALREQWNAPILRSEQHRIKRLTTRTKSQLQEDEWEQAWSHGRRLPLEEAVALGTRASTQVEDVSE